MHPALFRLVRFAPYAVVFIGWAATVVTGYIRGLKGTNKGSVKNEER